jgi:alpha-glucosidase (family GH31 glycosyl hydrolase)
VSDILSLTLQVVFETSDIVRVKLTETGKTRWEIPSSIINVQDASAKPASMNYEFTYVDYPFSFQVTRISDGAIIFQSSPALVYKNQYIELSTSMPSNAAVYGLGESARLKQALVRDTTYTLWGVDTPAIVFNTNLYGSYPFYLQLMNGAASGAMLMNR